MRGREKSSENAVTSGPSVWGGWFGQPLARVLPQYAPLVARQAGSESEVFASLPSLLTPSLLACSARPGASHGLLCRRDGYFFSSGDPSLIPNEYVIFALENSTPEPPEEGN